MSSKDDVTQPELHLTRKQIDELLAGFSSVAYTARVTGGLRNELYKIATETRPVLTTNFHIPTPNLDIAKQARTVNTSLLKTVEAARTAQKSLLATVDSAKVMRRTIVDAADMTTTASTLARSLSLGLSQDMKLWSNFLLDLRSLHSVTELNLHTSVSFNLKTATQLEDDQTAIETTTTTKNTYGNTTLTHSSELKLTARLNYIEGNQEAILNKLDKLEDIEALLRNGSHQLIPALIETFDYDDNKAVLTINNQEISMKAGSRLDQLCKLFFSNEATLQEKLHIEDIIDAYGEWHDFISKDEIKKWNDSFYQATRYLNTKIGMVLGSNKKFIIASNQEYYINPDCYHLFE